MSHFPRPTVFLRRCAIAGSLLCCAQQLPAESALLAAWQALASAAPREARTQFQQHPGSAEARLGEALATLQTPPTTPNSLTQARQLLVSLGQEADSAIARAASYYLGRTYQLDPFAPAPAQAAEQFESLLAGGADDVWAGLARTKLALLTLTVLPGLDDFDARLARVKILLAGTANPATQRDLHLLLAEARLYHGRRDETTLEHLNTPATGDHFDAMMQADLLIQRARLSALLGHHEAARTLFRDFLRRFPKDSRHYTVGEQLRELEARP